MTYELKTVIDALLEDIECTLGRFRGYTQTAYTPSGLKFSESAPRTLTAMTSHHTLLSDASPSNNYSQSHESTGSKQQDAISKITKSNTFGVLFIPPNQLSNAIETSNNLILRSPSSMGHRTLNSEKHDRTPRPLSGA